MRGGPASTSGGGGRNPTECPSTPLPPPAPASDDDLAGALPSLRKPELLAALRFVGKTAGVPAHTVKAVLIREVLAVLRGSEGDSKREAIGEFFFREH